MSRSGPEKNGGSWSVVFPPFFGATIVQNIAQPWAKTSLKEGHQLSEVVI